MNSKTGSYPEDGMLHHIEIYVSNLDRSIAFWSWLLTEKFSYTVYQQWEHGISFIMRDTYIVLVQTEEKFLNSGYNRKNTGLNHLAFYCEKRKFVDELTNDLMQRNISILYKDLHPFAGGKDYYAVYFEDPDRIKVEVVANE